MQGTDAVTVVIADVFMFGVLTLYFSAKFNNDCRITVGIDLVIAVMHH